MPIVRIDIYSGFSAEYKRSVMEAVHDALVKTFRIPNDDRNQVVREYTDENFDRSGGKTRQFTMIEIAAFSGRSRDAKRELYRRLVENLNKSPGILPSDVLITLNEIDLENWGVHGGQMADEVELGFSVKV